LIVVDTSVWIDLFRGVPTAEVQLTLELLNRDDAVALTDVVLGELLQGLENDVDADRLALRLGALNLLRLQSREDFRRAASLYRRARDAGKTVRRTVDCLIASVCIRERIPILHNDADFDRLAACTELEVVGSL
jgi:predicted nucleic acid-binding protein